MVLLATSTEMVKKSKPVIPSLLLMQEAKLVSASILIMTYFLLADVAFRN